MPIIKSTSRPPRVRHPVLADWPPGVFCPAAAGVVRGYPRTEATYERQLERLRANSAVARKRGLLNRRGVPNGYAGMRAQVAELRQEAANEGWRVVNVLQRNSSTPDERLDDGRLEAIQGGAAPVTDAERFAVAAAYCLGVMRDPTMTTRFRLKAARVILPFLAPMPKKAAAGLGESLEWLDGLVKEASG